MILRFFIRLNGCLSVILFWIFFLEDTKAKKTQKNPQPQYPNPPYIALYGVKGECHTGI